MPTLIRFEDGVFAEAANRFALADAEGPIADGCGVILPLSRFETDAPALLDNGRALGILLQPDEPVEALAYDLPRLSLVALNFPRYRDGRAYSAAVLLRTRYGFTGELRAVGDVLREQAGPMVRCGFDSFVPADGSRAAEWAAAAARYRHVYQRSADGRPPASVERC